MTNPADGVDRSSQYVRRLLAVLIIVVMVVVAGVGAWKGLYAAPSVSGPEGPIPAPDPGRTRPATIESTIDVATSRARAWDLEARLFAATAQLDFAANPNSDSTVPLGGWLVFVFVRGDGDDSEALTLMIERNRAEIVRESARSLGTDSAEIDLNQATTVAIDSGQALTIAEAERGLEFRTACLRNRHVARLSFHPGDQTNGASWIITYNDVRVANGPVLRVVVDAQTGQAAVEELGATIPESVDLNTCPA